MEGKDFAQGQLEVGKLEVQRPRRISVFVVKRLPKRSVSTAQALSAGRDPWARLMLLLRRRFEAEVEGHQTLGYPDGVAPS